MVHESQVSFFWFDVTVGRGKERGGGCGGGRLCVGGGKMPGGFKCTNCKVSHGMHEANAAMQQCMVHTLCSRHLVRAC